MNIDLDKCRPYKDFGKGFYLTDIQEQAEQMAYRVARIYGGKPVLNAFTIADDFMQNTNLKIKDFGNTATEEWASFILNNRSRKFTENSNPLSNQDNKYDIVIGCVANDDIALLFRQYQNELIDFASLIKGLTYKKLSKQYSFHTQKSIQLLTKIGV
ncbi:MAG: DUF3990 domain-containing protein [Neisseriaceae bacterium]|nr:DUF3990 domain-containing protein [Neisseriaceae bacterium]